MEMEEKIGKYNFIAEPFHVDFMGRLNLCVLGNHLLNCASFHAKDRGFGIATLNENHYTWVLSRLVIEMNDFPHEYKQFTINTWIENVYRLFTDRNYAIIDDKGNDIGYARSIWAMIGMQDRKPIDLLSINNGKISQYTINPPCPIEKPSRIKLKNTIKKQSHKVVYSDLDINGHMNSIKYIEHILDIFDIEYYKKYNINRFEIAYVAESYYGDFLEYLVEKIDEKSYNIEIKKNNSEIVCRSFIKFR